LSCVLISIFSVIIANPNFTFTQTQTSKSGIDIVLVLDLSYSMLAEDIAPNRLEKSKAVLQDFISKIQSDRVGMVIFAGKPFASFPLTHDYAFVKKYVERMTVENINQNLTHLQ
jgi:Ca-activated chloride channel family protein